MSVRKEVFYHNAKALLGKPAKRVWFRLNPLLEKTSMFVMKKQDNSQFTMPLQSVVICERILEDETAFQETCTEADFWEYLFAENWKGWSCVRVFDGQLMECLMETLHALEETKTIASRQTAVFTQNIRHIKRPLKGTDAVKEVREHLKVSFTYYGTRKGKLDSMFEGTECPTETLSVADYEDILLSDDEFELSETITPDKVQAPQNVAFSDFEDRKTGSKRAISFASGSNGDLSPQASGSLGSISRYEDDKDRFDVLTPKRILDTMREPQISYKEWIKNREELKANQSGDKSQFFPTIYSLAHFHCPRPPRSHSGGSAVKEKQHGVPPPEEADIKSSSKWLVETMENTTKCSQRTVDRLRKRLEEVAEQRNCQKQKNKPINGQHFTEAMRLVSNYADNPMVLPEFTRCYKVPTFEQYLVKLIKDREYDLRHRYNRRRVYKLPQRGKSQKHKDESDFIVDESLDWRSPSPEKKGRNKKEKFGERRLSLKEKNHRSPVKSKVSPGYLQRAAAIEEENAESTDESSSDEEIERNADYPKTWETENIVEIIVGITDCVAFRNNLSMINESDEEERRRIKPRSVSPESAGAQRSPVSSHPQKTSGSNASSSSSGRDSAPDEAKSTISLTPSPITPADLKGIKVTLSGNTSPQSNRPNSRSTTSSKSQTSTPSPGKLSNEQSPDKSPDGEDTGSSRGPSDPLANPDDITSPAPGGSYTPVLFDARKINRKYSFDKLKAKRKHQKKRGFRDILKKFTKIQKIAAIFRKGAMVKPKKGKKRAFTNPLCITPSPEPLEDFVGQAKERRGAIIPIEVITPDFRRPSAEEFRSKLLVALDNFVVRKEQVISNYRNRGVTSITFTRPEIFSQLHTEI